MTVTVSGAPSFLSLSGATGPSPLTATLTGVAPAAPGTYEITWTLSGGAGPLATISRTTTLTVGGMALDAPETLGASIVGYTTYGDYVVASEGTNGINARLGVWNGPWPWAYCQQEVGYPCTDIVNRITVEVDVQTGARLNFDFEFMQYGTPFLPDYLEAYIEDETGGPGESLLHWFGNPVFPNCWGNLWQSPRRTISVDLSKWPNRRVLLVIYVVDCLGHQTDALAVIHSIAIRGCQTTPLIPLSAEDQTVFEDHPNDPNESGLTTDMNAAVSCLRSAVAAACPGCSLTVTSAWRSPTYQAHLLEVWTKWKELAKVIDPDCQDLKTQIENEIAWHSMGRLKRRPSLPTGPHPRGVAIDANWPPAVTNIDALAATCGLCRSDKVNDDVHFLLTSELKGRPCPP